MLQPLERPDKTPKIADYHGHIGSKVFGAYERKQEATTASNSTAAEHYCGALIDKEAKQEIPVLSRFGVAIGMASSWRLP